jgi:hypothetical protein
MRTLVHAFPTNQSPPATSIGEPLHENGHTELATIGYLENIANPEPKAPLSHPRAKWVSPLHAQQERVADRRMEEL